MIKKYYDKLSAYPRLRILIIFVALLVIVITIMRMFSSHQVQHTVVPPSSIQSAPVSPNRPHQVGAGEYNQLAEIQKRQELQNVETSGRSYFENNLLQGGAPVTQQPAPSLAPSPSKPLTSKVVSPENFYNQESSSLKTNVETAPLPPPPSGPSPELIAQAVQSAESAMQGQLSQIAGSWEVPSFQTTGGGSASAGGGSLPASPGNVTSTAVVVKAGTIFFAVLEVTLNSDQATGTPVMATIVNGPLKGAKLLGSFTRQNDKLVVVFNTMNIASKSSSVGINAYAIDSETAQNALASSVNNHYLLRYGSLFGAAFLEGFGNAWSNVQGSTADSSGLINIYTAPPPEATAKTAMYQGFGQIGTNLGQQVGQIFNTPPTVILNAGTGLGVLFMSDLSL
jgi:intracellular multiplication protein IcmE